MYTLDEVREAGRNAADVALQPDAVGRDDVYMLCYTSGTTGDSKGVKVTHWGILSSALIFQDDSGFTEEDCVMNYLPAPHVFDQYITVAEMLAGGHHGYYQGSPLKLVEDCGVL